MITDPWNWCWVCYPPKLKVGGFSGFAHLSRNTYFAGVCVWHGANWKSEDVCEKQTPLSWTDILSRWHPVVNIIMILKNHLWNNQFKLRTKRGDANSFPKKTGLCLQPQVVCACNPGITCIKESTRHFKEVAHSHWIIGQPVTQLGNWKLPSTIPAFDWKLIL